MGIWNSYAPFLKKATVCPGLSKGFDNIVSTKKGYIEKFRLKLMTITAPSVMHLIFHTNCAIVAEIYSY
jgi:hypothetical protein